MKIRTDFVTNSSSSSFLIASKGLIESNELIYPLTLDNIKKIMANEFYWGVDPDDKHFGLCTFTSDYEDNKEDLESIGITEEQYIQLMEKFEELEELEDEEHSLRKFQILDELKITEEQYYSMILMDDWCFEQYQIAIKAIKEGKNVALASDGCCCYEGRDEILRIVEENELLWECGP